MIASNIEQLKKTLPPDVTLVAVSKFHSNENIMEAYNAGHRLFGENRPQEMTKKANELPKDIEWHFLGHLQSNKIKMVVPYASLIQSVNSIELLRLIDNYSSSKGFKTNCLLEVHIAHEESKQGFYPNEVISVLEELKSNPLRNTTICGLMGMASFTSDIDLVRNEFRTLSQLYKSIRESADSLNLTNRFSILSMGMSGDYKIAIEEGANMIRVGSAIFGSRNY